MAPPGAAEGEAVVLRASASAVTFQGFLAAYAPQHFRRGAAPGAGADEDGAGGEDAAEGGPGGVGAADEELSATLMRLAVRPGPPVLWRVFSCAARPESLWHQPPNRFCGGKLANRAQVLGHVGSSEIPPAKAPGLACQEGDRVRLLGAEALQHFTRPPGRFTEAGLVKALEELGVGRPSTYASTLAVLQARGLFLGNVPAIPVGPAGALQKGGPGARVENLSGQHQCARSAPGRGSLWPLNQQTVASQHAHSDTCGSRDVTVTWQLRKTA